MNDFFQCPSEVSLDATLRLPETWNPKHPSQAMLCRVHHMDTSVRYHFSEFENLDLRVIIPSKKTPRLVPAPPPPPHGRVTVIQDPEESPRIVPAMTQAMDASEIVAAINHAPSAANSHPVPLPEEDDQDLAAAQEHHSMDQLLDQFLEKFSDRILDRLADRIVQKLMQKLPLANTRPR